MKTRLTPAAVKSYIAASTVVRKAFDKQTGFLMDNLNHPSLHAKKYDEGTGMWQARVIVIGAFISRSRAIRTLSTR
jgi:hypothetical protein